MGQFVGEFGSLTKDPRGAVVVVVEAGVEKDLGFDTDLSGRGCGGGAGDGRRLLSGGRGFGDGRGGLDADG